MELSENENSKFYFKLDIRKEEDFKSYNLSLLPKGSLEKMMVCSLYLKKVKKIIER